MGRVLYAPVRQDSSAHTLPAPKDSIRTATGPVALAAMLTFLATTPCTMAPALLAPVPMALQTVQPHPVHRDITVTMQELAA